jgi:hypothetical protein
VANHKEPKCFTNKETNTNPLYSKPHKTSNDLSAFQIAHTSAFKETNTAAYLQSHRTAYKETNTSPLYWQPNPQPHQLSNASPIYRSTF